MKNEINVSFFFLRLCAYLRNPRKTKWSFRLILQVLLDMYYIAIVNNYLRSIRNTRIDDNIELHESHWDRHRQCTARSGWHI